MTSTQIAAGARVTFSYPRWGAYFGTVQAVQAHSSFSQPVVHVRCDDGRMVAFNADHVREV